MCSVPKKSPGIVTLINHTLIFEIINDTSKIKLKFFVNKR